MAGAVEEAAGAVQVTLLRTDGQQHAVEVLVHKSCEAQAWRRCGPTALPSPR